MIKQSNLSASELAQLESARAKLAESKRKGTFKLASAEMTAERSNALARMKQAERSAWQERRSQTRFEASPEAFRRVAGEELRDELREELSGEELREAQQFEREITAYNGGEK